MQRSRSASWRFRQADSQLLHVALFTREAAGLRVEPSRNIPPRLTWAVARHSAVLDADERAIAATQWAEWWGRLLAYVDDDAKWSEEERGHEVMERLRLMTERQAHIFDPPEFQSLASTPALRKAVITTFDEGLERFNLSKSNMHASTAAESLDWDVVRNAAESVAAERGIPPGDLRAVIHILDVEGSWSYLVAPGCALCSASLATDRNATAIVVHDVFASGSP